jgi:hypothetical protein
MRSLRGFDADAAWAHVAALVTSRRTDKSLLLAAIGAVAGPSGEDENDERDDDHDPRR